MGKFLATFPQFWALGKQFSDGTKYMMKKLKLLILSPPPSAHNAITQMTQIELQKMGHEVHIELALEDSQIIASSEKDNYDFVIYPCVCPSQKGSALSMSKLLESKRFLSIQQCEYHHYDKCTDCTCRHNKKGKRPYKNGVPNLSEMRSCCIKVVERNYSSNQKNIWARSTVNVERSRKDTLTKSSLYRNEVNFAVSEAVKKAIKNILIYQKPVEIIDGSVNEIETIFSNDDKNNNNNNNSNGKDSEEIDWNDTAQSIACKIMAFDSHPGLKDVFFGKEYTLHGCHEETLLGSDKHYVPKTILGTRNGSICIACGNGTALWITHLKPTSYGGIKLPATMVLPKEYANKLQTIGDDVETSWNDIYYEIDETVCYLHFDFLNGAMSTKDCKRLMCVFERLKERKDINVVVLMGGHEFFSNGIDFNCIEASQNPIDETFNNMNALNDLIKTIMFTDDKITIAAMRGNASGTGVMLALAADYIWTHDICLLKPHTKSMRLFGSGYWTYNLPKRVKEWHAMNLTENISHTVVGSEAKLIGLVDDLIGINGHHFEKNLKPHVRNLIQQTDFGHLLFQKKIQVHDEQWKMEIESYRSYETAVMRENIIDPAYHHSRRRFVYKSKPFTTPHHFVSTFGNLINGKEASKFIREGIKVDLKQSRYKRIPGLAIILVGGKQESHVYVNEKLKASDELGIKTQVFRFGEIDEQNSQSIQNEIIKKIHELNNDQNIDGIMVQLPLPPYLDSSKILCSIDVSKDVDGLNSYHIGEMAQHFYRGKYFLPATVKGILQLIQLYDVNVLGKKCVIVGNSNIVGLPISIALTRHLAQVTICNIHTMKLEEEINNADVIISAAGAGHLIHGDWIKPRAVVVDAGVKVVGRMPNGKLKIMGDVDFISAREKASLITPPIGGVGPMTVTALLHNTFESWKRKI